VAGVGEIVGEAAARVAQPFAQLAVVVPPENVGLVVPFLCNSLNGDSDVLFVAIE
jgi:hypothetical protein